MAQIKKGDVVRQIIPKPVVGTVQKFDVDPDTGDLQVLVVWPDADGDGIEESTYFKLDQVELVTE